MGVQISNFLLYGILVYVVYYVLKVYNIIGSSTGANIAREGRRKLKSARTKQLISKWMLSQFEGFALSTGGLNQRDVQDYAFIISRKKVRSKALNRDITPIELVGKLKLIGFLVFGVGLILFWLSKNIIFAAPILGIVYPMIYKAKAFEDIRREDLELEKDFPDLFLLLYSRLNRSPVARLSPILDDFIKSLEVSSGASEKSVIKRFAGDFRNLIEVYADDSLAISKLREKYRTATVINFSNLAIQAISGVDNRDKLAAFKEELAVRKMKEMEDNAARLIEAGSKVIWLVFLILAQFVIISWASKFSGSMGQLGGMLGF